MNRIQIQSLCIFVLLIFWMLIWNLISFDCEGYYKKQRKVFFQGTVIKKYRSNNHDTPTLGFRNQNGTVVEGGFTQLGDLWDSAEVGDSIYKALNSLEYRLIKIDTVLSYYPECDGRKIK